MGRSAKASLGTLANLANCSNVALSEASLVTVNAQTASLVGKAEAGSHAMIDVVFGVLNQLE